MSYTAKRSSIKVSPKGPGEPGPPLTSLRAATAQLLLATAAGVLLERSAERPSGSSRLERAHLAPAIIGPLAATAHLEFSRRPTRRLGQLVKILDVAALASGSALFLHRSLHDRPPIAAVTFASAGMLGLLLEREARAIELRHRKLRRKARLIDRLIPANRPRLDRVVIHV